jgi:hypothetical protein
MILIIIACKQTTTEVNICSTIHGAHKTNAKYTYDDLFKFISDYNPDIIGIEIRMEDVDSSDTYLSRYYPFEMREIIRKFKSKKIHGFDWLGTAIEKKAIPKNYFKELKVKKLEKKLNNDSTMANIVHDLARISKQKNEIVLNSSLQQLNDGRYDEYNTAYYGQMFKLLKETPYQEMSNFYKQRDENISKNMINIIKANEGKKLLFLMGADHRSYSLDRIKKEFGSQIILNNAFK